MKRSPPVNAGCVLSLHVVPRASRTELAGLHGTSLKIRLRAPPADGKANRELLTFISGRLGLPASSVELVAGQTGREKRVRILGMSEEAARAALGRPSS